MAAKKADVFADGWATYNIWQHSTQLRELYARRARDEVEEMICAAQAAELLEGVVRPGDSLLDAGCGTGYFFHSLRRRKIAVDYHGIDATEDFIEVGRAALSAFGLPANRLQMMRIEDFRGKADHVLCMNVISNIDNYHRPLERLLKAARHTLVLRESVKDGTSYNYVRDNFLDPGVDLKVHVNAYDRAELTSFIESYGFSVRQVTDRRTGGIPEEVIGYPHHWTFLVAQRNAA